MSMVRKIEPPRSQQLVSDYYRVAPREWSRMRYEVKTLRSLDSSEVVDQALAHTLCYGFHGDKRGR